MDPNKEIDNIGEITDQTENDEAVSVDDFIKQLEEKEKDLHITSETTIIEIAESFEDGELPDFLQADLLAEAPVQNKSPRPGLPRPEKPAMTGLEKEITNLKEQISRIEAERSELVQTTQRRARDLESFKARTERERQETLRTQVGNLATQMLPALDNLNRAVDFAFAMPADKRAEFQQFVDGIVLVSQQVNDVLAEMGVQPISTVGETFDPHYHEAVATEDTEDFEPNTISAELLRGYRIGERVIRHSMVKVARSPNFNGAASAPDPDAEPATDIESSPNEALTHHKEPTHSQD